MHQCVRCGNSYADNDESILRGCLKCGSIFFLYMKDESDIEQLNLVEAQLQEKDTNLERELTKHIEKTKESRKKKEKIGEAKKKGKVSKRKEAVEKTAEKTVETREDLEKKAKKQIGVEMVPSKMKKRDVIKVGRRRFAVEDMFGIETIRIPKDGVYEINIDALMRKKPIIVLERGKVYFIHLPSVFEGKERP